MAIRATCYTCKRVFDLPPEVATPAFRCQYCGGEVQISSADQSRGTDRIKTPTSAVNPALSAGGTAQAVASSIAVACPHCGAKCAMPAADPAPHVRCDACQKGLSAAYLPLEMWAGLGALAGAGSLSDSLLFILRARWNAGSVAPAEVLRQVADLRSVVEWLSTKPADRRSDFPLGVLPTAEVLKHFVLRVEKAEVQSKSAERVILVVPTKREEPREGDRAKAGSDGAAAGSAMIMSIGAVPQGCVFGFLARGPDGSTGALATERLQEVQQLIGAMIPRATFRYLAYRFAFGETMQPSSMALVTPAAMEKELRKLGLPHDRLKAVMDKLSA